MILPTVKVLREGGKGHRLINRADFDPARHVLADDRAAPVAPVVVTDPPKKGKRK